jgi:hypothetical protein
VSPDLQEVGEELPSSPTASEELSAVTEEEPLEFSVSSSTGFALARRHSALDIFSPTESRLESEMGRRGLPFLGACLWKKL